MGGVRAKVTMSQCHNVTVKGVFFRYFATIPSVIITECHLNFDFQDKYPGMQHEDWYRVVMAFIRDMQTCYDLTLPEIFSLSA